MTAAAQILDALKTAPGLQPFLLKCAQRAARGVPQPATMTLPQDVSYEEQRALSGIVGYPVARKRDGRVKLEMPDELRPPSAWAAVIASLGVQGAEDVSAVAATFQRAELLSGHPALIAELAETPEIVRFLKDATHARPWLKLYDWVAKREKSGAALTLSQLGSDLLGDSKSLRTGALRRQLVLLLSVFDGGELDDERVLLARFGLVDNPFTTHVAVFAPFTFTLADGSVWDFPFKLFERGLACELPLETVEKMASVAWQGDERHLTTSENAAPFASLVAQKRPSVYTEGYPNFAVKRLLRLLDAAGVTAEHAGDADLDGFRIAEEIGACIRVTRTVASEFLARANHSDGIPLTEAQVARLDKFREKTLDSPYAKDYRRLAERRCWFEQEAFHET